MSDLNSLKILVTGSSGFVGFNFIKKISKYKPICIFNKNKKKYKNIKFVRCNLSDYKKCKKLIEIYKPNFVFHFAALIKNKVNEDKNSSYTNNFIVTKNIVKSIKNFQNCTLVFLSTDKIYSIKKNKIDFYAKDKLICEDYIRKNIIKYFIFRAPIIHSDGSKKSSSFIDEALIKIKNKKKIKIYKNIKRCFVDIKLLNNFFYNLLFIKTNKYGIYNIGSKIMSYYERVIYICKMNRIMYSKYMLPIVGYEYPKIQNMSTKKFEKIFNFKFL